jgi:tetratricopeptide (TPR) repeat protein
MRLDEALDHAEPAIRTFRELGSRWELASALGDRGAIHRMAGRFDDAEADLREAFVLCRDLRERALVTWTAAELARISAMRGDTSGARQILADPATSPADGEPGSVTAVLMAAAVLALAEGDRETALAKSLAALETESGHRGVPNARAGLIWWLGNVFEPEAAGGAEALERARELLENHHWRQALAEPELARELGLDEVPGLRP